MVIWIRWGWWWFCGSNILVVVGMLAVVVAAILLVLEIVMVFGLPSIGYDDGDFVSDCVQ